MRYAAYELTTGRILRTGTTPMLAWQERPGEGVLEVREGITDRTHWVDPASRQLLPREVLVARVTRPGPGEIRVVIPTDRERLPVTVDLTTYDVAAEAGEVVVELMSAVPCGWWIRVDLPDLYLVDLRVEVEG